MSVDQQTSGSPAVQATGCQRQCCRSRVTRADNLAFMRTLDDECCDLIYVDPPDKEARLEILKIHSQEMNTGPGVNEFINHIAEVTEGYSGADLENIIREAGMNAIREHGANLEKIEKKHFEKALRESSPSLNEDLLKSYEQLAKKMTKRKIKLDLGYMT